MDEKERSESGNPIYRYEQRDEPWTTPGLADSSLEAIAEHIQTHIGKIDMVWREIIPDLIHIRIYRVAPTPERPYWTLVTSGMSDLRMQVPKGGEDWAYAELMLCLPKDWKISWEDFKNEANYWPVRWMKTLARFPHEYRAWISWGHSMPNGDPPEPFHESVPFDCMLLMRPTTVSPDFWTLEIREDKTIHFFSVVPLHPEERVFKLKHGADELDELFEKNEVSEIVDVSRRDVTKHSR